MDISSSSWNFFSNSERTKSSQFRRPAFRFSRTAMEISADWQRFRRTNLGEMPVGASLRLNWPRQLARSFEGWTCLRSDIPTRFCSFSYLGLIGLSFTLWVECLTLACSGPSLCSQSMLQHLLPPMYSCGSGKSTEGHQQLFHKADDAVPPTDFWPTWYHQAVLPGPWATKFPYYWWTGRPAEGIDNERGEREEHHDLG